MAGGGKRIGAGRKPGVPNGKTAKMAQAVAETGLTPLDFMLAALRDETRDFAERMDAAKSAAPYCHPKRVPIDGDGKDAGLTVNVYTGVPRGNADS
jgi:hypothetical protein